MSRHQNQIKTILVATTTTTATNGLVISEPNISRVGVEQYHGILTFLTKATRFCWRGYTSASTSESSTVCFLSEGYHDVWIS